MNRDVTFGFRTDAKERQMIALVAKRLERTESDTIRLIVRQVAEQLGVAPTSQNDRRADQLEQAA